MKRVVWSVLIFSFIMVGLLAGTLQAAPRYHYHDLGVLPEDTYSIAYGINNLGEVVGTSINNPPPPANPIAHAFLWSQGAMQDLGSLPNQTYTQAFGINNLGQVVGSSGASACLWDHGAPQVLDNLGGTSAVAQAINDLGQVVGYSNPPGSNSRAFLWENGGLPHNLGTLTGGNYSNAVAINDLGQIVGTATISGGYSRAGIWDSQSLSIQQNLGTFGGLVSYSSGINNNGQVVGVAQAGDYVYHGFSWQGAPMQDLGPFPGNGYGGGINLRGQIVSGSGNGPYLWDRGAWYNLNDLTVNRGSITLKDAGAINDSGQVVGKASNNHAYLLTPINPTPAIMLLLD
jgi:probable HAF family extracellular repeat protein